MESHPQKIVPESIGVIAKPNDVRQPQNHVRDVPQFIFSLYCLFTCKTNYRLLSYNRKWAIYYIFFIPLSFKVRGALASWLVHWLVHWTLDRADRVQALAGAMHCVLGQDTLLSLCLSPPRCINGYRQIYCWGVTLQKYS